ncbi:MAG: hypothetical protein IKN80_02000 [Clostridiales bacterium]|nr:hypothetical protein [Clostridiales bacterium]
MSRSDSIIRHTFRNSVAGIILAAVAVLLGVVIDGIIIGRYLGPDCMAAYTLTAPIISIFTAVSSILSTGVQVICAQRIGANDIPGARRAFSVCMTGTVIISVNLTITAVIFRNDIAVLLGASGDSAALLPLASDYLLGLALAGPAGIFLFEFNSLIRLDGGSTRIIVAVAVMTVLDVIGDLLDIFVFKGGMLGMGLATAISYIVALVIMGLHFLKKNIIFRFSFRDMRMRDLRDILFTGAPSAVGAASTALRTLVHNLIMAGTALSINAVAAFGVLNTVFNFTSCVLIGVAITTSMIAGMILGEQDRKSARELIIIAVKTAVIIGTGLAAVIFIFAQPLASVFGSEDGEVMVELATRGLRIFSVSLIIYGINSVFTNYLQGIRRMGCSLVFSFLHTFVFTAAAAIALAGHFEEDAVWISFGVGEVLTLLSLCAYAYLRTGNLLFLPKNWGVSEDDVLNLTVTGGSEVKNACDKVTEFCTAKGASPEKAAVMSACAEELGSIIAEHGFDGNKMLEMRLIYKDDELVMRMRDNCRPYDPTAQMKRHDASVNYLNSLDLNIVTIRCSSH